MMQQPQVPAPTHVGGVFLDVALMLNLTARVNPGYALMMVAMIGVAHTVAMTGRPFSMHDGACTPRCSHNR